MPASLTSLLLLALGVLALGAGLWALERLKGRTRRLWDDVRVGRALHDISDKSLGRSHAPDELEELLLGVATVAKTLTALLEVSPGEARARLLVASAPGLQGASFRAAETLFAAL